MLLAIDTSSGTSVAVVDRERGVLAEATETDTRRHAEVIGEFIAFSLAEAGVAPHELSAVIAGMGPGPFTGLRVGIAAARAFAFGAGRPCLPLISHDAVALERLPSTPGPLLVVTDARRREVYWSAYDGLDDDGIPIRRGEPSLVRPDDLDEAVRQQCGEEFVRTATRTDPTATPVSAGALGLLGEALHAHGRPFAADVPLYLRSPDVTVPGAPKRVS